MGSVLGLLDSLTRQILCYEAYEKDDTCTSPVESRDVMWGGPIEMDRSSSSDRTFLLYQQDPSI